MLDSWKTPRTKMLKFSYSRVLLLICLLFALSFPERNAQAFAHSTILDADGTLHVAWDFTEDEITFEVTAKTRGYFGLGFSPNGGMTGSDIVLGWVDDNTGQGHLSDRHAVGQSKPLKDAILNYNLIGSSQNDTHTTIRFSRPLVSCDEDDHTIKDETVRLIWAYNDIDPGTDGDPSYHAGNRGSKSVFLLNPQKSIPEPPSDVIHQSFLNPQVLIPDVDTTYWCQAFNVPHLPAKHHVITIEPIIHPGLESEIHHILLYACYHETNSSTPGLGHECYHPNMPEDFYGCTQIFYAWAVGDGTFHFPEHVGLPFGYDGDPTMLLMETHYNNPQLKSGLVDSSGLQLTMTPTLRQHDAGILETGVVVSDNHVIPPYSNSFQTNGYCFPECLTQAMENNNQEEIKIFAYMLHSHLMGHAITVRHFRYGRELLPIAKDKNYDFNFQQTRHLAEEAKVVSGDHFVVECFYRSDKRTKVTHGGLSTSDEMCLGFLYYYPKIPLSDCLSIASNTRLGDIMGVKALANGTITSPTEHSGKSLLEYIDHDIDWRNEETRTQLERGFNKEGIDGYYGTCVDGLLGYPVMYSKRPLPRTLETRQEQTTCGSAWLTASMTWMLAVVIAWFQNE